jgi:hypothetical protein
MRSGVFSSSLLYAQVLQVQLRLWPCDLVFFPIHGGSEGWFDGRVLSVLR